MLFKFDCLRTDYMYTPIGIDNANPCFSWHINSHEINCFEKYMVKVRLYDIMSNLLWESDAIKANKTQILYSGAPLETATYYLWDINIYDICDANFFGQSSKTFFMTGMLYNELSNSVWISHPEKTENCPVFRKEFNIQEKKIKSAKIISSALGNYDFYVDGKRIGNFTPDGKELFDELKPGFTEPKMHVHYQSYDVTHLIDNNRTHVFSSIVSNGWWMGRVVGNHESHVMNPNREGNKNAFIMAAIIKYEDNTTEFVRTDKSWMVSDCSKIRHSDIYDGEVQDLRRPCDLKLPMFDCNNLTKEDKSKWYFAEENNEFRGIINSSCGHNVYERKDLEFEGKPLNGKFPLYLVENESIIIDFSQNFSGVESLLVEGPVGTKVEINHAEVLTENGCMDYTHNQNAKATSIFFLNGKGIEKLRPIMTYYGFQYISIKADKPIKIYDAKGIVLTAISKEMEKGSVQTNNSYINQLIKNVYWSQIDNFGSVPTDCPQRSERHAFTGDVQIYCKTACYFADVYQYITKWLLEDVTYLQHTNGSYPSTAPQSSIIERYGMAGWSDGGVIIPYHLYQMTGNIHVLKQHYPSMKRFIEWLIKNNGPGNHYGDWACSNEEYNNNFTLKDFIAKAYFCIVLDMYSEICLHLYNNEIISSLNNNTLKIEDYLKESTLCRELYSKNCNEFEEQFTDSDGLINSLNDCNGQRNQTACVYALYFDLVKNISIKEKIIKQLKDNLIFYNYTVQTGFLGTPYLLKTLSKCGMSEVAYNVLNGKNYPSWLFSVTQGANTIWEFWDGRASRNHFAYGSVASWLYENAAGIKSMVYKDGLTHLILQPETIITDVINELNARCEIRNGNVCVNWKIQNKTLYCKVQIPSLTQAQLILPYSSGQKWVSDKKVDLVQNSNKLEFKLNPGTYKFEISI